MFREMRKENLRFLHTSIRKCVDLREILPSYRVSATLWRWLVAGWADWAFKVLLSAFSGRIALSRHGSASAGLSWVSRSTGMADQPALRRLPVTAAPSGADDKKARLHDE